METNKTHNKDLQVLLASVDNRFDSQTIIPKFEEIAKELFNNYHIQKGNQEYYFVNLEFYYFSKSHQDIITYPRHYSEGKWFFHPSGVDLTFNSIITSKETEIIDANNDFFGGILIREIVKKSDMKKPFVGPHICEWELFDAFDALSSTTSIPYIEHNKNLGLSDEQIRNARCQRYFPYKGNKVESKFEELKKDFKNTTITLKQFEEFLNAEYAYEINLDDLKRRL